MTNAAVNGISRTAKSGRIHAQLSGIRVSCNRVAACGVSVGEPVKFEVFFDYLCPFVFRAATLIDGVRRSGRDVDVRWRYFSLTQVNSKDDGWTVWDAPETEKVKGRLAFQAAEAARRQGRFDALHMPLLLARHRERLDIDEPSVVEEVAASAGLDMARFHDDMASPDILEPLRRDHTEAVEANGIFGTPTFVFDDGASAYVRLAKPVDGESPEPVFDRLLEIAASEPRILEIKRPVRPVPE
jgi:predicted DsbA family dithiol-disulfide isomerase